MPRKLSALGLGITSGTGVSYLLFYSGYDKVKKEFRITEKVGKIVSFKDRQFSLNEINKVLALTGLTVQGLALILYLNDWGYYHTSVNDRYTLYMTSLGMLTAHGAYSSINYFNRFTNRYPLNVRAAMLLGMSGWACFFGARYFGWGDTIAPGMLLALLHFCLMEWDGKNRKLKVRPYAYTALATGTIALLYALKTLFLNVD